MVTSVLLDETMRKERFGRHARHLAVEAKVKAWINKTNPLFCLERKKNSLALVHPSVHIIAPINNSPLVSILYPSDNTLYGTQINNFISTKIFVVVDAVP